MRPLFSCNAKRALHFKRGQRKRSCIKGQIMPTFTSQYEIRGKNPICSVKTFSLIDHNYLPERKFIGTSSILAWGLSGVLSTDSVFRLERFFFHLLFIHVVWEVKLTRCFLSPSHSYFSLGIICGHLWGSLAVSGSFAVGHESSGGSSEFRLLTSNFKLPTSNFRLQTSDFRLPTAVAIKSGGRATRLLPYSKMLLVAITFFSFCSRVDYALEGSTFFTSKGDLSRLFHTERPGGVRTTIAKHHGRYSKSDHLCQDGVE